MENETKESDDAAPPSNDKDVKDKKGKEKATQKEKKSENNEYEYDSSDEEDIRNTIGNIPVNWYDDYEHIGYNIDGKQIRKPKRGDELDHFLRRMEDGDAGVTVQDPQTGQDVVLSKEDVETLTRIKNAKVPSGKYDLYSDLVPWFSSEVLETPLRDLPESKKSFIPSLSEKRKVNR